MDAKTLKAHSDECYKKNIKPIMQELKDVKSTQIAHGLTLANTGKDITYIKEAMNDIKEAHKETSEFIKEAPNMFASKPYVDKIMWLALLTLLGWVGWIGQTFIVYLLDK